MASGAAIQLDLTNGKSLPGQGVYFYPTFFNSGGRHIIQGYVTDIITDLSLEFLKSRPKDKPFFLMCHHKAPHRPWQPEEKYRATFAGKHILEPVTLRDDYATRTDAIRECTQKVCYELTRRDLKLKPPAGRKARSSTNGWPSNQPRWKSKSRAIKRC